MVVVYPNPDDLKMEVVIIRIHFYNYKYEYKCGIDFLKRNMDMEM
jgi:hypothetical protein